MDEIDKIEDEELGRAGGDLAHLMPINAFEASVELNWTTDGALAELENAARRVGRVIGRKVSDGGTRLAVRMGAGWLNMMPAVVDIYITPLGDARCRIRIKGTAKESLIKQRAGEGAVRRLLAATRFGSVSTTSSDTGPVSGAG